MYSEILFINDGSWDSSLNVLNQLKTNDQRVAIIDLSRNFGKEIALTAGLDYAAGDIVVVIDADLQDPPELIPDLINGIKSGYDVVYAQRHSRAGETSLKKFTAAVFYRIIQKLGRTTLPADTGDFRALSRRAVNALKEIREQHRFMKGLFSWIGFPQKSIGYERDARYAGNTKFNYWRLWNFSLEGITSHSSAPLKVATYIGFLIALAAFLYAIFVLVKTLLFGDPVKGYPSLAILILFLGGVQLIFIGMIGEYLGRTYNESKRRPLYFINKFYSSSLFNKVQAEKHS